MNMHFLLLLFEKADFGNACCFFYQPVFHVLYVSLSTCMYFIENTSLQGMA